MQKKLYDIKREYSIYVFRATNGDKLELDEIMETCLRDVLDVLCISIE